MKNKCRGCGKQFVVKPWPTVKQVFCTKTCRITYFNSGKYMDYIRRRGYNLKHDFGITYSDYAKMHNKQRGLCAICKQPETGHNGRWRKSTLQLAVDHDHKTGKIRGLLCRRCNQAIGKLNEDPRLLDRAAAYLRKYSD